MEIILIIVGLFLLTLLQEYRDSKRAYKPPKPTARPIYTTKELRKLLQTNSKEVVLPTQIIETTQTLFADQLMSRTDKKVYLKSKEWKALKHLRLQKANHTCEVTGCNNVLNLHLHHETTTLGDEDLEDLRIICEEHHTIIHNTLGYSRLTFFKINIPETQGNIFKKPEHTLIPD